MSIMNGKAELDDWRNGRGRNKSNSGGSSRKNKNRNDRDTRSGSGGRGYAEAERGYMFMKSSYINDDVRAEMENDTDEMDERNNNRVDQRADEIYAFLDEFQKTADDFRQCKDVVINQFPGIVKYVRSYYSQKNSPQFNDAINKLILVVSTSNFANVLQSILEHGDWVDDGSYDKCWRGLAFALSTALETTCERMHSSVIRKYATEILPRMWRPEITDIVRTTGVTRDLALDLIIAIPVVESEWNSSNLDAFYSRFLDKMLIHAEDNMDVLNWEVQGMLYKKFFGDGKDALRVIGKYLTSKPRKQLESEVEKAVYQEFIKMLYSKLDEYDIKDIAYVFRYVAKVRKDTNNAETIFNSKDAAKFDDVKKGLFQVMDQEKETMEYLA